MLEKLNPNLDFADSDIISHFYSVKDDALTIRIVRWNTKIVDVHFYSPIFFIINYSCYIEHLYRNKKSNNEFADYALEKGNSIIDTNMYQLFQFVDKDNHPEIEIICKNIHIAEVKN